MPKTIKIKKGLDIPLKGIPSDVITQDNSTGIFAISPDDYPGINWKSIVKPGDIVQTGSPLFVDKKSGEIKLVSPIEGSVKEVNRGERRHINFISIQGEIKDKILEKIPLSTSDEIRKALCENGLWALMRQRPFDIVPSPDSIPRDIFVTAFDSAPLAAEMDDSELLPWLERGLEILSALTSGKVYLGIKPGQNIDSRFAEIYIYDGPHPAGNVGTQIAAIKPVNKGETVWTLDALSTARMGLLFGKGVLSFKTIVAVTGPEVNDPHLVKTAFGASLSSLLKEFISNDNEKRIIAGNVLTGIKESINGFLHYPYRQITVIKEGDNADEFMGWASVNPGKYSVKRSFPAFLKGLSRPFDFDARIKGGKRAMILSGEYDKVFPFDIYPEYLLKAIIAGDIDRMEKLGIYEVAPEDFALPEFVDTSKNELQKTVRDGLEYLRKELS